MRLKMTLHRGMYRKAANFRRAKIFDLDLQLTSNI